MRIRRRAKRIGAAMKFKWYESKITMIMYFVLRALVVLCLVMQLRRQDYENVAVCVLTLGLMLLPYFIEKHFRIELPNLLENIILLFIFAAEILGEINNFYGIIPYWDTILHTMNGFLMAAIGLSLFDILNKNLKMINLSPVFLCLFALSFSMTIGVIWEFFEYGMDVKFGLDMQKDEYVNELRSVTLDPEQNNNVVVVDDVSYVVLLDEENNEITRLNGYLDIGRNDTMNDLIVNFIGAVVFNVFGYLYIKNRDEKSFVKGLMPIKPF